MSRMSNQRRWYSELLVANRVIFVPHLHLALHRVWPSRNFAMLDTHKTRMIGLINYNDILRRFHRIPERNGRTDGRTDRQTDRQTELLHQYRTSVCWRAIKIENISNRIEEATASFRVAGFMSLLWLQPNTIKYHFPFIDNNGRTRRPLTPIKYMW